MGRRVVFIHPDLGIGGAERLIIDIANVLDEKDYEVSFVTNHCDKSHSFDEIKKNKYQVEVIGDFIPRSVFGRYLALCAYIRMLFLSLTFVFFTDKKIRADLCFVDQIPMAIPILKLFRKKVIYYCHHPDLLGSPEGGRLKKLYRLPLDWTEMKCTNQADVILVNSRYTADVFRRTFPKITKEIRILYPTISKTHLEVIPTITETAIKEALPTNVGLVFLSINRFHPAKKIELAIESAVELRKKVTDVVWRDFLLVLAGGYDPNSPTNARYYEQLKKLVDDNYLGDKVIFVKSPDDFTKACLIAGCYCLIYTPVKEHFGIVPLEAMSLGKPVIACDSGGPRETIEDNVNGYLCEPNPQSMSAVMVKIINNKTAPRMGTKGKERLNTLFSPDKFTETTLKTVNEIFDNQL